MQHAKAQILGSFLGTQERLTSIRSHGFVSLDLPKAGVLVTEIAEAGDQQPFVRGGSRLVKLVAGIPFGHTEQPAL